MGIRLGDIRKEFIKLYGIDISREKLRRLEDKGLFKFSREDTSDFRTCTAAEYEEIKNIILLMETGLSWESIKDKDRMALDKHIAAVKKIAPTLKVPKNWS